MINALKKLFVKQEVSFIKESPKADTYDLRGKASFESYIIYLISISKDKYTKVHDSTLAGKYGVTERTIRRWIVELEQRGIIRRETRGNKRRIYAATMSAGQKNVRQSRPKCPPSVRRVGQNVRHYDIENLNSLSVPEIKPQAQVKPVISEERRKELEILNYDKTPFQDDWLWE